MDIETELLHQINDSALSCSERAWLRCEYAKKLEEAGSYDAAQDVLGELWQRIGERPQTGGLDERTTGELLLRVGVLSGWIGSTRQIAGAQERAKNLITESITIFETLQDTVKVAEALIDLGYCYWREGALDEARVVLKDALDRLSDKESEVRAVALLRSAMVERTSTRYSDALRIHTENRPLVEASDNHALKGKFHNELAILLGVLGAAEHQESYTDRAIVEYTAASFHFEQAGHNRYRACVESNLGTFCFDTARFGEAHEHLNHARRLLVNLKDKAHVAQVDETRARVFLAEGKNVEAERVVRGAVRALETGGQQQILAEALTTHGIALERSGNHTQARRTLQRATTVAEQAGDFEGAGQAVLTLIEELGERFTPADLSALYERAAEFLATSQHPGILARLSACARRIFYIVTPHLRHSEQERAGRFVAPDGFGFSFWDEIERYEAYLIERALKNAGGLLSRAASLLGVTHQTLNGMLKGRHEALFPLRTPPEPRRRSIFRKQSPRNTAGCRLRRGTALITILQVEAHKVVADAVKEALEQAGWRVVTCTDGAAAITSMASNARYNLFLFDNHPPDVNGLEIVRYARQLPHRQQTPIIMLSAINVAREARSAGVDVFLMKPWGAGELVETITKLLKADEDENYQRR